MLKGENGLVKFCAVEKCDYAFEKEGSYIKFIFTTYTENESTNALEILVEEEYADELANWLFVSWEYLMTMNELTPQQIAIVRDGISKIEDETKRGELYLELQKKVPYHNQRDNKSLATKEDVTNNSSWLKDGDTVGGLMCNLTSVAMAFEMLGVSKDDMINAYEKKYGKKLPQNINDFEDILEAINRNEKFGHRKEYAVWDSIAQICGIRQLTIEWQTSLRKRNEENEIINHLRQGNGVVVSLYKGKGHIVRLQNIGDFGLCIDDPYGKILNLAQRELNVASGYKDSEKDNRNTKENNSIVGNDDVISWDDFNMSFTTDKSGEIITKNYNSEYKKGQLKDEKDIDDKNVKVQYYHVCGATIKCFKIYTK